jgi:pimeloyl-ACP methyl ester carboxylesterase
MPRVPANGIEIEYESYGEPTDPAVILIAGLGEQMYGVEFPVDFCTGLAERGFRVIRFDNRDCGLSTGFDGIDVPSNSDISAALEPGVQPDVPYTSYDMADDVAGLCEALSIGAAHIVGASMGGYIARWVALRHPAIVRSLTLIMTTGGDRKTLPPPSPATADAMSSKGTRQPDRETAIRKYISAWRSYNGPNYPFHEDWVTEVAATQYDRAYRPEGVRRHAAATYATPDLKDVQTSIAVPIVIIHGTHDPVLPVEHAHASAAALPNATLEIFEGMGHEMPPEAWPRMFDAIAAVAAAATSAP